MQRVIDFLSQPFPESRPWRARVIGNLLVAAFIAVFLFVFVPFDLDLAPGSLAVNAATFGVITFAVCVGFDVGMAAVGIRQDVVSWSLGRWVVSMLVMISLIGVANYAYVAYLGGGGFSIDFMLEMLVNTWLVGVFPLVMGGVLRIQRETAYYKEVSKDLKAHPSLDQEQVDIVLNDANGVQACTIDLGDLLYLEAQQNYVLVHYRSEQGRSSYHKIRVTLSGLLDQLTSTDIIRCHRSFAIYLPAISDVTGNAQGLRLHLDLSELVVPVSRSYVSVVRTALSEVE